MGLVFRQNCFACSWNDISTQINYLLTQSKRHFSLSVPVPPRSWLNVYGITEVRNSSLKEQGSGPVQKLKCWTKTGDFPKRNVSNNWGSARISVPHASCASSDNLVFPRPSSKLVKLGTGQTAYELAASPGRRQARWVCMGWGKLKTGVQTLVCKGYPSL